MFKPDFFKNFYNECLSLKEQKKFLGSSSVEIFLQKSLKDFLRYNFNPWELILFSPLQQLSSRKEWSEVLTLTHNFITKYNLKCSLNDKHSPLGFETPIMDTWIYHGSHHLDKKLLEELVSFGWTLDKDFYNKNLRMMNGSATYSTDGTYRWDFPKAYELWLSYFKDLDLTLENQIALRQHFPKENTKF